MKISRLILLLAFVTAAFSSCKKDEETTKKSADIENAPGAKAAYDHSSAGVYKGVLVGSSGYFKISLKNGTDTVSCKLVFDNQTAYLTTTSLTNWTPGMAISNAVFAGTLNGQSVSLSLSCNADGTNVSVSVFYPGHTIGVSVVKETSTTLVKCYEGTYTDGSGQYGTFNLAVYGTNVYGFRKDPESAGSFMGYVNGNTLVVDPQGNPKTFAIDDNSIRGTFPGDNNATVTVTGHRSM